MCGEYFFNLLGVYFHGEVRQVQLVPRCQDNVIAPVKIDSIK